jgi:alcohol dehydrogenase
VDDFDATELATVRRYIIPYGGLLRGRLAAGETLVVNGATGAYGTAAVLAAVARKQSALGAVAHAGGVRVTTVTLTGNAQKDAGVPRERFVVVPTWRSTLSGRRATQTRRRQRCTNISC